MPTCSPLAMAALPAGARSGRPGWPHRPFAAPFHPKTAQGHFWGIFRGSVGPSGPRGATAAGIDAFRLMVAVSDVPSGGRTVERRFDAQIVSGRCSGADDGPEGGNRARFAGGPPFECQAQAADTRRRRATTASPPSEKAKSGRPAGNGTAEITVTSILTGTNKYPCASVVYVPVTWS